MTASVIDAIEQGDVRVFEKIPPQLSDADKRSVLAVQASVRARRLPYTYLEIGSHRGGSLQTFLADPLCEKVYSIDKRPVSMPPDERRKFRYAAVSTEQMRAELARYYPDVLRKLTCFETDASHVSSSEVDSPPVVCFIDGEHTDQASFQDFLFCSSIRAEQAIILFHDVQIIFRGLRRCLEYLEDAQQRFRFYLLPGKMAAIETNGLDLVHSPPLFTRLTDAKSEALEALERLGHYRDWVFTSRLGRLARRISELNSQLQR